jgi:two-component system response regulator HydG
MQELLRRASTVAGADAPVVLRGESGSGKEVVARAIHANSPRRAKPFVAINCAALPTELLESELFGHSKGAFTGAIAEHVGLFEAAHQGILFLDEIAEMPLQLQAKLLRAVQDGEIRRVGGARTFSVDVRILCATHQDLGQAVRERRFREDLYFRLKVFTLVVPPLRERKTDIIPMALMFLRQEAGAARRFTSRATATLERYSWPGNVRELQSAVKHGVVFAGNGDIDTQHLPEELSAPGRPASTSPLASLVEVERAHIERVLEHCGGHQAEAARILGIGRTTLWRKLRELGIAA